MTAAARAADGFSARYGRPPAGVWSAPGRVNLIGEHTDYNDGLAMPFALPQRTVVAAAPRTDGVLRCASLDVVAEDADPVPIALADLRPGRVPGWGAYPAGVAWALVEHDAAIPGADLAVAGDVPIGAGLASSAALECAVACALLGLAGIEPGAPGAPSRRDVAALASRAENEFVGVPTGPLDQVAAMCCVAEHVLLVDVAANETEQLPFRTVGTGGPAVLVVDTRVRHRVGDSAYADRRAGCRRGAELLGIDSLRALSPGGRSAPRHHDLDAALAGLPAGLRRLVRHVTGENRRVLAVAEELRAGAPDRIGHQLTASHASLRDDYQVSCPELDLAVEAALDAGALGARMTGAGFGGSALALLRNGSLTAAVSDAVREAFERGGLAEPGVFVAAASAGAGRDR